MYPSLCLKNKWAYLGVPPNKLKKYFDFIISVKVQRYSFSALSNPILDITRMTTLSFSLLIQLRKMELSLQIDTEQVRLKFYRAALRINPASQGVYHQNYFLWGQRVFDRLVIVCREKGISLLSQNKGAIVLIFAHYFLYSKLAKAICITLSIHPHPVSDSQYVVGKTFLILLRQVKRTNYSLSQILGGEKKLSKDINILFNYQLLRIIKIISKHLSIQSNHLCFQQSFKESPNFRKL